jgi:hypothetical protein
MTAEGSNVGGFGASVWYRKGKECAGLGTMSLCCQLVVRRRISHRGNSDRAYTN